MNQLFPHPKKCLLFEMTLPFILDIDECESSAMNDCHDNSTCINNIGSFSCVCNIGFTGNGTNCFSTDFNLI